MPQIAQQDNTYEILPFTFGYTCKMEHEELKTVAMLLWQGVERLP